MDAERAVEDWLLVGVVSAPMGVRGEVKIDLATDFPDRFKLLQRLFVGPERRSMALASARRHVGRVVLHFAGVDDRVTAEALRGMELFIPRSEAIPLPEGHYFHDQILGLKAVTTAGQYLGAVVDILQTGANDVYVVRDGAREVLIPAIHDVVRSIDLDAQIITIEPVEGLL